MTDHTPPTGFIDLHCHILPGMDDGPEDMDESAEMAALAKDDGISHIFATPHILPGVFENDSRKIMEAWGVFRKSIPNNVSILYGADVRITSDMADRLARNEIPTLNGSPYLLIELPSYAMPLNCGHLIYTLKCRGTIPILTHPERYPYIAGKIAYLRDLRSEGALCQVTAQSITGDFGKDVKKSVLTMIEKGLVDFVATDAHGTHNRPPILSKAFREVIRQFDAGTAKRLFYSNPQEILNSIPL